MTCPPPKPQETQVWDSGLATKTQTLQGRAAMVIAEHLPVRQWAEPPSPHHQPEVLQSPF